MSSLVGYSKLGYSGVIYSYAFDQTNYSVAAGSDVTVKLFIRETFDVGEASLLDTDGLQSVGARVAFAGAGGVIEPAQFFSFVGNSAFDGSSVVDIDPGISVGIVEYVDFFSPSVTVARGSGFNELLIGTFTFHAGNIAGEVTDLHAVDFSTFSIETTTGNFDILDPNILAAAAVITVDGSSVSTVPEPSSIVLTMILAPLGFIVRRLKRVDQP